MLVSLSRGRITLLIHQLLSDYLNVIHHNPPT